MLGFDLDIWDYITFVVVLIIAAGALAAAVFLLGLPGRIAVARRLLTRLPLLLFRGLRTRLVRDSR